MMTKRELLNLLSDKSDDAIIVLSNESGGYTHGVGVRVIQLVLDVVDPEDYGPHLDIDQYNRIFNRDHSEGIECIVIER